MPSRDVTQGDLDDFSEAITKIIAHAMPKILTRSEDFYVISVRSRDAWNLGSGRSSEWFRDTLDLVEETARRDALLEAAAAFAQDTPIRDVAKTLERIAWKGKVQ